MTPFKQRVLAVSVAAALSLACGGAAAQAGQTVKVAWIDAPHVPQGWENGFLFEKTTSTLFCGDLFTQPGLGEHALVETDVLGPSDAFRKAMDYWAYAPHTGATLARMAALNPRTLACMHGSAWRGDGAKLLGALAATLTPR